MTTGQFLEAADSREITRQMAYDLVLADERKATVAGVRPDAATPSRRLSMKDPDLLKKLMTAAGGTN
jgi:hypothetical protein